MELVKRKKKLLKRKKSTVSEIKILSKEVIKPREKEKVDPNFLLPTSSTLLNCACSDHPTGGYGVGKVANLIGDSSSGKSLLALSCFAEMCMSKRWDEYDFIYDDVEAALEFNLDYLFGTEVSDRIEMQTTSDTIQDFYGNIMATIHNGKPFVYILDSLDALTSVEELKRANSQAKRVTGEKTDKEKGSYKMEKPKMLTEVLRVVARDIKNIEGLLLIVSQTRDNIGFGFSEKTRSGGRALKFYSCHEMWLSIIKTLKGKGRAIGVNTNAKVSKNKITGKVRDCLFPIYYDYGVDDISSCVDFLIENGVWKMGKLKSVNPRTKTKGEGRTIQATDFKLEGTKAKIITEIELRSLEKDLQLLVGETWNNIEEACRLQRKPKYV